MKLKTVICLIFLQLIGATHLAFARTQSLTTGVSVGYDFNDRTYNNVQDDEMTAEEAAQNKKQLDEEDDYNRIRINPLIRFVSESESDSLELRFNPKIKYELDDTDYDMDQDFSASFKKAATKKLSFKASEQYVRSDYYYNSNNDQQETEVVDTTQIDTATETDPTLSTDIGRHKYWKNTAKLSTNYNYGDEKNTGLGLSYIALRNDETEGQNYDDYDRYELFLKNDHRFNVRWKTALEGKFIKGDFEDQAVSEDTAETPVSDDLQEYRLNANLENNSMRHDPLFLSYSYIGVRYDDSRQSNNDIHQAQLRWKHFIDERAYTIFGAGPSYEKSEDSSGSWGGNGIAAFNYKVKDTLFNIQIEKLYDVSNFSGNTERGVVDSWVAGMKLTHQLFESTGLFVGSTYTYEDRNYSYADSDTLSDTESNSEGKETTAYHTDRFTGYLGLNYSFFKDYSLQLKYNYLNQKSDRPNEDYDEHRLLLTLSWQGEVLRW